MTNLARYSLEKAIKETQWQFKSEQGKEIYFIARKRVVMRVVKQDSMIV